MFAAQADQLYQNYVSQPYNPHSGFLFKPLPDGYAFLGHAGDARHIPPSHVFFDVICSPFKPLGYFEQGVVTRKSWEWLDKKNSEIPGNQHVNQYFYNEDYLIKLLELNADAFDPPQKAYKKSEIFDEDNRVKTGGAARFVAGHRARVQGKLLALIHTAFGNQNLLAVKDQIKIPDAPGLRDVIRLQETFSAHSWRNIQVLLRAYQEVDLVAELLKRLPTDAEYYVENGQLKKVDGSCQVIPIIVDVVNGNQFIQGQEGLISFKAAE